MSPVRGPARIAALCVRCLVVLTLVNLVVAVVGSTFAGDSFVGFTVGIYPYIVAVAIVPIAVVGFPAGLLVSHLLRNEPDEGRHIAAFAVTGAVLSVLICAAVQLVQGPAAWVVVLVAAAEGAIGAGGARWWSGRTRWRRAGTQVDGDAVDVALQA
ncbi:hypothetical protein [Cellulomonas sp. URHE0023]|uniref:hypothetical protein n=1 Tax=Cellulomonas sp. URHE0023 TaxID=1380354 RepID=UPI00048422C7|nr:hypothetical protein [Cellulomonas sp. URHE0023]